MSSSILAVYQQLGLVCLLVTKMCFVQSPSWFCHEGSNRFYVLFTRWIQGINPGDLANIQSDVPGLCSLHDLYTSGVLWAEKKIHFGIKPLYCTFIPLSLLSQHGTF